MLSLPLHRYQTMMRRLVAVGFVAASAMVVLLLEPQATSWHYFNDAAHTFLQPNR